MSSYQARRILSHSKVRTCHFILKFAPGLFAATWSPSVTVIPQILAYRNATSATFLMHDFEVNSLARFDWDAPQARYTIHHFTNGQDTLMHLHCVSFPLSEINSRTPTLPPWAHDLALYNDQIVPREILHSAYELAGYDIERALGQRDMSLPQEVWTILDGALRGRNGAARNMALPNADGEGYTRSDGTDGMAVD